MLRKKGKKNVNRQDFTIYDSADAPKAVTRLKKSIITETLSGEKSWDEVATDEFDLVEKQNEDGTKNLVFRKKRNSNLIVNNAKHGAEYPEIIWYHISQYVRPEDVGRFAAVNKATYATIKHKSFWRMLFKRYCEGHPNLPEKLKYDSSYKLYGLRQRVIRALYHTYDVFVKRLAQQASQDSSPHDLVKRRCVNMWYHKGPTYWLVYFKLKKHNSRQRAAPSRDFIEELGRIDANPEEDVKVLQVTCQNFHEVPPMLGMTLSSVKMMLEQGFSHHRLFLGFSTSQYVSRDIHPEYSVVLDTVVKILVYDWWHPKYPYFEDRLPTNVRDDESVPVLKKDFLSLS